MNSLREFESTGRQAFYVLAIKKDARLNGSKISSQKKCNTFLKSLRLKVFFGAILSMSGLAYDGTPEVKITSS